MTETITQILSVIVAGALVAWSVVKLWLNQMIKKVDSTEERVDRLEREVVEIQATKSILSEGLEEIKRSQAAMHARLDTYTREIGVLIGEMRSWRKDDR